jgi:hypothetical protein
MESNSFILEHVLKILIAQNIDLLPLTSSHAVQLTTYDIMFELMKLNRYDLFFLLDWIFRLTQFFFGIVDGFVNIFTFVWY